MKRNAHQKDNFVDAQKLNMLSLLLLMQKQFRNILEVFLDDPSHKIITKKEFSKFIYGELLENGLKEGDMHKLYEKMFEAVCFKYVVSLRNVRIKIRRQTISLQAF